MEKTIQYRINGGKWTTMTIVEGETLSLQVETGDVVEFKGNNSNYGDICYFGGYHDDWSEVYQTAIYEVEGNIMSMTYGEDFVDYFEYESSHPYGSNFFSSNGLISAENLILPATALTSFCYQSMFINCESLTTAPELPATTLAIYCYQKMFENCTSLTQAPSLPATTLANYCYGIMFYGCTSLTTAPELPATTMAQSCYQDMFAECKSLTRAPELRAATLAINCYSFMFAGCTNLNYIECLATNMTANGCTSGWVTDVSSSGTFVKNPNMSSWTTGENGIPDGWTVQDAS